MTKYAVRILSFHNHSAAIVSDVLDRPSVQKLIFPAHLHVAPKRSIRLAHSDEFELSLVAKEFYAKDESFVHIPLDGENGIEFSATIHFGKLVLPNVTNFMFTNNHLEQGVVTLATLKAMLAEVISVFQADSASVFDTYGIKIPHPSGGYGFEQPKYFKTPDFKSYPIDVDWITYYGPAILTFLRRERFDMLHTCAEKYDLHSGIMVILQEEPFRNDNPLHRKRKMQAETELRLSDLV